MRGAAINAVCHVRIGCRVIVQRGERVLAQKTAHPDLGVCCEVPGRCLRTSHPSTEVH